MASQLSVTPPSSQTKTTTVPAKKGPKVLLFDINTDIVTPGNTKDKKTISIDPYDKKPDVSHRETVAIITRRQCPAVQFLDTIPKDGQIDAVNVSVTQPVEMDELAKLTGLPLTRGNLSSYKNQIEQMLLLPPTPTKNSTAQEKEAYTEAYLQKDDKFKSIIGNPDFFDTFRRLEDLSAEKIPVYISAGNEDPNSTMSNTVNLYNFVKNATVVGALDKNGNKTAYSTDNSLVTRWEKGSFNITQIRDKSGNIMGYNISDGDNVDVPVSQTTGRPAKGNPFKKALLINTLEGTSYSTPEANGKDLRLKFGRACDN